jgi:hypothetical protein
MRGESASETAAAGKAGLCLNNREFTIGSNRKFDQEASRLPTEREICQPCRWRSRGVRPTWLAARRVSDHGHMRWFRQDRFTPARPIIAVILRRYRVVCIPVALSSPRRPFLSLRVHRFRPVCCFASKKPLLFNSKSFQFVNGVGILALRRGVDLHRLPRAPHPPRLYAVRPRLLLGVPLCVVQLFAQMPILQPAHGHPHAHANSGARPRCRYHRPPACVPVRLPP